MITHKTGRYILAKPLKNFNLENVKPTQSNRRKQQLKIIKIEVKPSPIVTDISEYMKKSEV